MPRKSNACEAHSANGGCEDAWTMARAMTNRERERERNGIRMHNNHQDHYSSHDPTCQANSSEQGPHESWAKPKGAVFLSASSKPWRCSACSASQGICARRRFQVGQSVGGVSGARFLNFLHAVCGCPACPRYFPVSLYAALRNQVPDESEFPLSGMVYRWPWVLSLQFEATSLFTTSL